MSQSATVESLPIAFEVVKAMQVDGLEWGEGYRPMGGFVKLNGFTPNTREIVDGCSTQFQWLCLMEKYPKQATIS